MMNREQAKKELHRELSEFPQAEIYFTGHNIVASFLFDKGSQEAVRAYASARDLTTQDFGNGNIIVVCTPENDPATNERHYLMGEAEKRTDKLDKAVKALADIENEPETRIAQSAISHTIQRLRNLRRRMVKRALAQ